MGDIPVNLLFTPFWGTKESHWQMQMQGDWLAGKYFWQPKDTSLPILEKVKSR